MNEEAALIDAEIKKLPLETREQVALAYQAIAAMISEGGNAVILAIALIGAELQGE